jgi:hypothetical protein
LEVQVKRAAVVIVFLSALSAPACVAPAAVAQQPCRVEGAWRRVGAKENGQPDTLRAGGIKLVTRRHFVWIYTAVNRPTAAPRTAAESLRVLAGSRAAGGTYTVRGNRYTEHIEYASDPRWIGTDIAFTCRTAGRRWYHSGTVLVPDSPSGVKLDEVWEKLE